MKTLVTSLSVENVQIKNKLEELSKIYEMGLEERRKADFEVEELKLQIEYLREVIELNLDKMTKVPEAKIE